MVYYLQDTETFSAYFLTQELEEGKQPYSISGNQDVA